MEMTKGMPINLMIQITCRTERKKVEQKSEQSLKSLWDNVKRFNICIIRTPGEDKVTEVGNILEEKMRRKKKKKE